MAGFWFSSSNLLFLQLESQNMWPMKSMPFDFRDERKVERKDL